MKTKQTALIKVWDSDSYSSVVFTARTIKNGRRENVREQSSAMHCVREDF